MKKNSWMLSLAAGPMLAAFLASPGQAGANTWKNAGGDFLWSGPNWADPTSWVDGDDATFGAIGAGTVTLDVPAIAHSLNFTAPGYTLISSLAENVLTLAGTEPTVSADADVTLGASLLGTDGLVLQGKNPDTTLILTSGPTGNRYSGGTYIKSGTVILKGTSVNANGSAYTIDSLEGLDAGATLREGNSNDGLDTAASNIKVPNGQFGFQGNVSPVHHLNLTGGTFDVNGNDNNQQHPQPSGTGIIMNGTPHARGILKFVGTGQTTTFSGRIMDGGTTITRANAGPGYQMNVDSQGGTAGTLILAGSNSFTGFLRIGNGGTIKLSGEGTLGYPAPINCPSRQIIQNNGTIDLNGTSQKTGFYFCNAGGKIINSAIGTLSTLSLCYNATNLVPASQGGIATSIQDDPETTGLIGITKEGVAIQTMSGVNNTYHGDTVVNDGTLRLDNIGSLSANSTYRLFTKRGSLVLNFEGVAQVKALFIDGVPMPKGVYDSGTAPLAGTGAIEVLTAPNMWKNTSGDFAWNGGSANWTDPAIWIDGEDAFFGAVGVGAVTLDAPVTAHNIGFGVPGYTLTEIPGENFLTLAGAAPTITAHADVTLGASLRGTEGLTLEAKSPETTITMTSGSTGNRYSGGTYIKSGTVILKGTSVNANGSAYTIDSLEGLDAGATLREGNSNDGLDTAASNVKVPNGQFGFQGNVSPVHHLNLTGGTFDVNGNDNNQQHPQPSGTGIIMNGTPNARGILKFVSTGQTTTFSGHIMDGGTTIARANAGPGYQMNVDSQGGTAGTLILAGSNSFTGFLRIGNGGTIKLSGEGTLGYPAPINCPSRQIIQNNGTIDLNGTSQKTGFYFCNAGGKIINSAIGTLSTLTVCYNATNLVPASQGGIATSIQDDPATTGLIGITKEGVAIQTMSGVNNTYHGDTVVNDGTLRLDNVGTPSRNSAYRLSSSKGALVLNYEGIAPVKALYIDGVSLPNGVYGEGTPGITGLGFIQVVGNLEFIASKNEVQFSWGIEGYKLQVQTGGLQGSWTDYPGGNTSPVVVPFDAGVQAAFFRIVPQ